MGMYNFLLDHWGLLCGYSLFTLTPLIYIHPVFNLAQSDDPSMDLECQPLATNNVETMLDPVWEKYWATDQPDFPALYEPYDENVQHKYNNVDFASNYTYTPTSSNLTGSVFSEDCPSPSQDPQLTSPKVSPGNSDGRQRSRSTQSNNCRKVKPIHTSRDPTKPYERESSKRAQMKGATGDVCWDTKRGRSINKTAERNSSPLQYVNSEQSKKYQKRNQCASSKYRNRQREARENLETVEKDMAQVNHDLSRCVTDLKDEVYHLKMKVFQHANCDCPLIQEYIANHVNRYILELEGKRQYQ
jgi:chemotaxis protein histidine kinase CheA